jgi:hypothetical protein
LKGGGMASRQGRDGKGGKEMGLDTSRVNEGEGGSNSRR